MKLKLLTSLSAAVLVSACASYAPPPPPPPPPGPATFNPADFEWSAKDGRASITGAVTYSGKAGAYSCAGGSVVLTPDAPYSRERIMRLYGSAGPLAVPVAQVRARQTRKAGEAYSAYVRTARCDASGRFTFNDLPAGGWFVITLAKPVKGQGEAMAMLRQVRTRRDDALTVTLP